MIEKIKGKDHKVIKLNGKIEKYSPKKMKKSPLSEAEHISYVYMVCFFSSFSYTLF